MTSTLQDLSRDRRIEDPTNLWVIHPAGRTLLPWFIAKGISANAVSLGGLALGTLAALAYGQWTAWPFAVAGLILSIAWLIADGLDGMIARATGTASPLGRVLDGVCDHGVFILIYVSLALSLGTVEGWALAVSAGAAHAFQSNLYESERARFHRRCKGIGASIATAPSRSSVVQGYDRLARSIDRFAAPFDRMLLDHDNPAALAQTYGAEATRPMRLMSLLTANVRVYAIFLACVIGNPRLFWWAELIPLNAILIIGLMQHRAVEARLVRRFSPASAFPTLSDTTSSQRT